MVVEMVGGDKLGLAGAVAMSPMVPI